MLVLPLATLFFSQPVHKHIKTVHVINSCHLDIGFAPGGPVGAASGKSATSADIMNQYFHEWIPNAIKVGAELERGVAGYTDRKLGFMFQSWVLALFFDCPPGLLVRCPFPRRPALLEIPEDVQRKGLRGAGCRLGRAAVGA